MLTKDRLIRLCKARKHLRTVGHAELSIDEVAKTADMSRFHFVRQFKAIFGETPVQCRTGARLDRAKELLVQGDDSITDICLAVGFSSLGSFSALFSHRFGRAPSRYRDEFAGSIEKAAPHCMTILRTAWERDSQIRRSQGTSV